MFAESIFVDQWAAAVLRIPRRRLTHWRSSVASSAPAAHAGSGALARGWEALRQHWPEYLMEAAELGLFMLSACLFGVLLEHPDSPVHRAIADPFLRRVLMGVAMGSTAIAIIYSPLGQCSGAHFNPSVTLTFFRLGKIERWDAAFYVLAQFAGGIAGVFVALLLLRERVALPSVGYVASLPGPRGVAFVFLAEVVITFVLMSVILRVSNTPRIARWTGLFAGTLVWLYISFEAPISGMSMNPARTFGSAFFPRMGRAVDLLHRAAAGDAGRDGTLRAPRRAAQRALRQAPSLQRKALYLPL